MLKRVEPLRNELQQLENESEATKVKCEEIDRVIDALERSISKYKEEYAVLIAQAQAIKTDLAAVELKVERSVALLGSLAQERERWEQGSEGFQQQMATILGESSLYGRCCPVVGPRCALSQARLMQ